MAVKTWLWPGAVVLALAGCGESTDGAAIGTTTSPGSAGMSPAGGDTTSDGMTVPAPPVGGGDDAPGSVDTDAATPAPVVPVDPNDAYFRLDTVRITEPTLVLKPIAGQFIGGLETDITANVQQAVTEALTSDNEPDEDDDGQGDDGFVDLSIMIRFDDGVDMANPGGVVAAGGGACPFPLGSAGCGGVESVPFIAVDYTNRGTGEICELAGTSRTAPGPCAVTDFIDDISLDIVAIGTVPLEAGQIIASYEGNPVAGLTSGWVRGFISEQTAMTTRLPSELPLSAILIGIAPNTPLIDFLSDADRSDNDGVPGWWFEMEFTAVPYEFSG